MTSEEYLVRRTQNDWKFFRTVPYTAFRHVIKIHPLKQKIVAEIVKTARTDPMVKRIIIFGSSTRYDCNIHSDLDICVQWKENPYDDEGLLRPFTRNICHVISEVTKGNCDLIPYDEERIKGSFVEKAIKEGVVVYHEQNV